MWPIIAVVAAVGGYVFGRHEGEREKERPASSPPPRALPANVATTPAPVARAAAVVKAPPPSPVPPPAPKYPEEGRAAVDRALALEAIDGLEQLGIMQAGLLAARRAMDGATLEQLRQLEARLIAESHAEQEFHEN